MPLYNPPSAAGGAADPSTNGLRLTLESGVAVSTSDQTAKTTLYLTPYVSGAIALYISSAWTLKLTAQVSVALGTLTADLPYDVFAYWTGSAVAIELLAWTNGTTRATALTTQDGVYVKTGATDRRYVGTIRTTSTTTTEDSQAKRFVWNGPEPWRQVPNRPLVSPAESTGSWIWSTLTWRQANANAANKVEFVIGLPTSVLAHAKTLVNTSASSAGSIGIGIDSTSVNSAKDSDVIWNDNGYSNISADAGDVLAAGYHYLAWLEMGSTGGNNIFYGNGSIFGIATSGRLTAQVPG